ncbi:MULTISPECIES: YdaS family helix-turn-helix protein [unclassified Paraburkholderia]|uniref:transcriptional regulator n=1 Tax=unclassified Paraburkholderia TaxID=2615204 RepID=UPI00160A38A6|nr:MULTISPECIES: YdaS family helix-turn-helix protein [unclassified Paraburkholderia]MBB5444621.1 DNA-binding transcriptional regulator YdaS (Cro superfamily) [Paraburkholderia sp. WSM4177]MBB5485445.1 DNA-binding transcriptional regulator YdaS (Cro superfamily) [Paraburkholderia sp. WSM4180]
MENTTAPSSTPAVGEAIDLLGGDSAVADLLGVRPWAISKWRKRFPPNRTLWLAEKTGWQKTPHQLCPDFYPNPLDGIPPTQIVDGEVIAAIDDVQPPVGGFTKHSKLA